MSGVPYHYKETISRMNKAIADYREGLLRITRDYEAVYVRIDHSRPGAHGLTANQLADDTQQADIGRAKRILNWQSVFGKEWEKVAAANARSSAELLRTQPSLIDFRRDHPPMASRIPAHIALGSHQIFSKRFPAWCHAPCHFRLPGPSFCRKTTRRTSALRMPSFFACYRLCRRDNWN